MQPYDNKNKKAMKGNSIMKKKLTKPEKKTEIFKKVILLNSPRPNNENCDCSCPTINIC